MEDGSCLSVQEAKPKTSISALQELSVAFRFGNPMYDMIRSVGLTDQVFQIDVSLPVLGITASGIAPVKMKAKHKAAENLINKICESAESGNDLKEVPNEVLLKCRDMLRSTKFIEDDENFNNLTDCLRLLKEWCFTNGVDPPAYECTNIFGLAHDKTYCMSCRVLELVTSGEGKTKKLASRIAADRMLCLLSSRTPDTS